MPNFVIEDNGNLGLGFGQAQKYGRAKPINISQTINLSLKVNYQTILGTELEERSEVQNITRKRNKDKILLENGIRTKYY
jgi:hypothetical protein